ncbi:hypothetical protein [Ignavibacterium album]|uniref:hypothetical protein n=1 Tax=Ignavibacterium album TaxID=591197 RepID=UPI0026F16837|nr:hypothetical protein [Ignavibacterium album]
MKLRNFYCKKILQAVNAPPKFNFSDCVFAPKSKPNPETYVHKSEQQYLKTPKVANLLKKLNLNLPGFLNKSRFQNFISKIYKKRFDFDK